MFIEYVTFVLALSPQFHTANNTIGGFVTIYANVS